MRRSRKSLTTRQREGQKKKTAKALESIGYTVAILNAITRQLDHNSEHLDRCKKFVSKP